MIRSLSIRAIAFTIAFPAAVANAQSYPTKPVRVIVPFAAGAGTDAISRILAQKLGESLTQQFIVDNRPGAGGTIGTEAVAKAAGDGYTLLFAPAAHAINPSIYPKLRFDTERDFTVITVAASLPVVLGVEAKVPAQNLKELVALAKAKPGTLSIGSAGNGTVFHLTGELFKAAADVKIDHVPFKGGAPAVAALVGGQISMAFETSLTLYPHVKAGKVRALAVASAKRIALMPDVPTLAEAGYPGILAENWYAFYAPSATAAPIVKTLHAEIAKALAAPDVRERLAAQGAEIRETTPEQAAAFVRAEIAKWAKVVKDAGVKLD